jgi:hypothetical protein
MQGQLEKLNFMERRMMKQSYGTADICRQVCGDIGSYEAKQENRMWLCRRMRDHFEGWMKANEGLGDSEKMKLKKIWSLVCTEVMLRACRDIVAARSYHMEAGETMEPSKQVEHCRMLENLQISWCTFWCCVQEGAGWEDVENLVCSHYVEVCLQDQLVERKEELKDYAANVKKPCSLDVLFAGMPALVWSFVQKPGSSSGGVDKKTH